MKTCIVCLEAKPLLQFYLHKDMADGHINKCISCCKLQQRQKHASLNKDEVASYKRGKYREAPHKRYAERIKRQYGLTMEQLEKLKQSQGNLCAICHESGDLVVDHDHKTGVVRGLLHRNCNAALGLFKDSPDVLYSASVYLSKRVF